MTGFPGTLALNKRTTKYHYLSVSCELKVTTGLCDVITTLLIVSHGGLVNKTPPFLKAFVVLKDMTKEKERLSERGRNTYTKRE